MSYNQIERAVYSCRHIIYSECLTQLIQQKLCSSIHFNNIFIKSINNYLNYLWSCHPPQLSVLYVIILIFAFLWPISFCSGQCIHVVFPHNVMWSVDSLNLLSIRSYWHIEDLAMGKEGALHVNPMPPPPPPSTFDMGSDFGHGCGCRHFFQMVPNIAEARITLRAGGESWLTWIWI
jgi:hypothetical protein